ncbi:hypothetical protein V6N12_050896 [Hibiscus sabdariffa]|uniref:Uncharacterized protein n=1 Tax=Hibiscus sabdariffa TaxID=183260 RepID=A0ABR2GEX9_9ROSI
MTSPRFVRVKKGDGGQSQDNKEQNTLANANDKPESDLRSKTTLNIDGSIKIATDEEATEATATKQSEENPQSLVTETPMDEI